MNRFVLTMLCLLLSGAMALAQDPADKKGNPLFAENGTDGWKTFAGCKEFSVAKHVVHGRPGSGMGYLTDAPANLQVSFHLTTETPAGEQELPDLEGVSFAFNIGKDLDLNAQYSLLISRSMIQLTRYADGKAAATPETQKMLSEVLDGGKQFLDAGTEYEIVIRLSDGILHVSIDGKEALKQALKQPVDRAGIGFLVDYGDTRLRDARMREIRK